MSISAKFLQKFRSLKADAQPQPPPKHRNSVENSADFDTRDYQLGDEEKERKEYPKTEKKKKENDPRPPSPSKPLQTQALGNVINIMNSNNVHIGTNITNNLSTSPSASEEHKSSEDLVTKTPDIIAVLESQITPEHVHLSCVSRHLGRSWKSFFRSVGYTQGQIETFEENEAQYGVQEVRYKLLLDWKQSDQDGTLGALARALWQHGDKTVVRELAAVAQRTNKHS